MLDRGTCMSWTSGIGDPRRWLRLIALGVGVSLGIAAAAAAAFWLQDHLPKRTIWQAKLYFLIGIELVFGLWNCLKGVQKFCNILDLFYLYQTSVECQNQFTTNIVKKLISCWIACILLWRATIFEEGMMLSANLFY